MARVTEYVSIFLLFIGILFVFMHWPFAHVLLGCALLGLGISYGVVFPLRVAKLKGALRKSAYILFMVAGTCLGLALGLAGVSKLLVEVFYSETLFTVMEVVRIVAIVGVIASLFYIGSQGNGQPGTLYHAMASWLRIRLLVISVWMGLGLLLGTILR